LVSNGNVLFFLWDVGFVASYENLEEEKKFVFAERIFILGRSCALYFSLGFL